MEHRKVVTILPHDYYEALRKRASEDLRPVELEARYLLQQELAKGMASSEGEREPTEVGV